MRSKIIVLFIILFLSSSHPTIAHSLNNTLTQENIILGLFGTATMLIVGKILCTIYYEHFWRTTDMIDYCQKSFKTIHETMEEHKKMYEIEAQLSDWDLKERIYTTCLGAYPFITYHSAISDSLYTLNTHMHSLQRSLRRISSKQKYLASDIDNNDLLQTITQLHAQGTYLESPLKRTISMIAILKKRVALFHEYNEDYHNWSIQEEKTQENN